jgi:hypothetical protein
VLADPLITLSRAPDVTSGHVHKIVLGQATDAFLHRAGTRAEPLGQIVEVGRLLVLHCPKHPGLRVAEVDVCHR